MPDLVNGVDDDTDSTLERGTLLCAPHVGGLALIAQASAKFAESVDQGWATLHQAVPRWPLRAVPWGMVDESERAGKPKYRMTIDLSWPHEGMMKGVTSVNGASDRSAWPPARMMRVRDVAEAASSSNTLSGLVAISSSSSRARVVAAVRPLVSPPKVTLPRSRRTSAGLVSSSLPL